MANPQEPLFVDRNCVEYFARKITRLINPYLHVEGHSGTNARADIERMLEAGSLEQRDSNILKHILQFCIRLDETQPDGLIVSMSGRQYSAFVGIRKRYLNDRLNSQFAILRNFKSTPSKVAQ